MTILDIWNKAQADIKTAVGETSYDTWLANLKALEKEPGTLVLQAPDEFFKGWIVEHYAGVIERSLKGGGRAIAVEFEVNPGILNKPTQEKLGSFERNFQRDGQSSNLNPRLVFDHFVVGPSNRFAFAAAQAVAESPAKAYNPFFIYGPVGLGKTHLMQAITHQVQKLHPSLKICYLSSEQFTNELINAIRHRNTETFRQKYRNIDVLLIDDIHFIAGKESTQEEFFHTFNTLHDNHKQIIISSDRPPKEISNLEERLVSRFAWGLITDIQPPDFETRVAILRKKIEREPVSVPDDVIFFIAQLIKTNIRELEGALVRTMAYSLMEEEPITLELTKEVLKDLLREPKKLITVDFIQRCVSEEFGRSLQELKTKRRNKTIVLPRQVAMYLSRELTDLSLPEIGEFFGGKDHTTVLHSYNKIKEELIN